uniref:Nuclear envelope pore membrane protein POM 121C n=1 Tax=Castor canadensis TaxID=51338 RepID=A0A8C0WZG5_CASCN
SRRPGSLCTSLCTSAGPDPEAKEMTPSALEDERKRTVKEEGEILGDDQENKRKRHDGLGSRKAAPESLQANGDSASFVPEPESLMTGLISHNSDDHKSKQLCTSSVTSTHTGGIPCFSQNAITSSYSSTGGISQLWKRRAPTASPFSSQASSSSQTSERPAKKAREEVLHHRANSKAPQVTHKESQEERASNVTTGTQKDSRTSPSTPASFRSRRRKTQLLLCRSGDPLTLPPPPQLSYPITAEDLDLERKARFQWFNKALEDKTDALSSSVPEKSPATQPSFTFTLPAASPASSLASLQAPGSKLLLETCNKMENPGDQPISPEPDATATTLAPIPPKTPGLQDPLGSSLPGTSSVALLRLPPASTMTPVMNTKSLPAPQAETSAKEAHCSAPQIVSCLGCRTEGLPTLPPPPLLACLLLVPDPSLFLTPPKMESDSPMSCSPSATPGGSSSSTLLATTGTTTLTLKPIFGSMGPPTSAPLSMPFKQTATTVAATAPSTVASATTAGTSTDAASKLSFSFRVNSLASTTRSSTRTMASTSQPFLFGAPPASATSFPGAMGPILQSCQPQTLQTSAAASPFGQPLSSAAQMATTGSSTVGFSGFSCPITTSATNTISQSTLTFGITTTSAFHVPFGCASQPAFGATGKVQQQEAPKTAVAAGWGSAFAFGNSAALAPPAGPARAPEALDGCAPSAIHDGKGSASALRAAARTQPTFSGTTAAFSLPAVTTSGFGAATQATSTGTSTSKLGGSTRSHLAFGGSAAPPGSGGSRVHTATPGTSTSSNPGSLSFRVGQSGTTGASTSFGGLSQSALGTPGQSGAFSFKVATTPGRKVVSGGASMPSTLALSVGPAGSSLSLGSSSTATDRVVRARSLGSVAPSVPIGAEPKTPVARQRLHAHR